MNNLNSHCLYCMIVNTVLRKECAKNGHVLRLFIVFHGTLTQIETTSRTPDEHALRFHRGQKKQKKTSKISQILHPIN